MALFFFKGIAVLHTNERWNSKARELIMRIRRRSAWQTPRCNERGGNVKTVENKIQQYYPHHPQHGDRHESPSLEILPTAET
jgi:hypothetical protein